MKNTTKAHSSSLFLLELTIAIVIFSLASGVSLQFFAKAHLWNKEAKAITFFSGECSLAAEITKVSSSREELHASLLTVYPEGKATNDGLILYFDEAFLPSHEEKARFTYYINYDIKGNFLNCDMKVIDLHSDLAIYELDYRHFVKGK